MEKELEALKQAKIAELKELESKIEALKRENNTNLMEKNIQELQNMVYSKTHVLHNKNKEISKLNLKIKSLNEQSENIEAQFNKSMQTKNNLEADITSIESKQKTTQENRVKIEEEIVQLNEKIRETKENIIIQEDTIRKLESDRESIQKTFAHEMENLSKSLKIVNEKIQFLKQQNYDNFVKYNSELVVKTPIINTNPEIMFQNIEPDFRKIIVKHIYNFNHIINSNYCYFGNERLYFDNIQKYLQVSGYTIKNNLVIHHTQQITDVLRNQITNFMKSNFSNILIDIIENDILKIILSKIDYDTLINYFKNINHYSTSNPPFDDVSKFILFINFLGTNGKCNFTQQITFKIKEKTSK
tara:strand:- start:759 stop:1832 length:1074 start_codon:yes stop_codon:yes gene_type:complete